MYGNADKSGHSVLNFGAERIELFGALKTERALVSNELQ